MDFNFIFRQGTLRRQVTVDLIIFLENLTLMVYARDKWLDHENNASEQYKTIYKMSALVIMACQFGGVFLKLIFYAFCHPWSELIRNPENKGSQDADITNIFDRSKLNEEFKREHSCEYFK